MTAYDLVSFAQWRNERLAAGDYRGLMGRIFSGWDRLELGEVQPWTDEDEQYILTWLNTLLAQAMSWHSNDAR